MHLRINLLSPERKQQAIRWLQFHFGVKQCLYLGTVTLLFWSILWWTGWLLRGQLVLLQASENNQRVAAMTQELSGYQNEIGQANTRAQQVLDREQQHPRWSKLFERLEALLPDTITLDALVNVDYRVSIAGKADNRDVLMQFRDRLSQDSCFSDVQLPLSNLFTQEAVDFQMDLTLRKECLKTFSL